MNSSFLLRGIHKIHTLFGWCSPTPASSHQCLYRFNRATVNCAGDPGGRTWCWAWTVGICWWMLMMMIIWKRIHGAAIYGVPWIPSIYPLYVSIHTSTMDPMGSGKRLTGWWFFATPLKKSQLGWWHSQLNGKIKAMFRTTNQWSSGKGFSWFCWGYSCWLLVFHTFDKCGRWSWWCIDCRGQ